MSSSSDQRSTHLKLVTVGDFDPQSDSAIEYDFIGRVIAGRYKIVSHIGGGGMADVFRATDGQLGIDVAVKLLKPRMASDELRARMVQEARAAARVRHANLVRVYCTDRLDETAYIVMELLDGPNLEQYLREHPGQRLPWREALELLLPALAALHAVHERGYVHRDIKTGNLLIAREPGQRSTAVVIDLGLVKPDRALRDAASPPTTETGRLLCTPGYTSPEQAAGLPVDRRSDVYSMAVTLYRVLTGRLPFQAARGQPVMNVLAHHIYNPPTRLADAAPGVDIPPAIAAVIESALHKRPAGRPQTMLAFAEALRDAAAAATPASPAAIRRPHVLLLALGLTVALASLTTTREQARIVRGDGTFAAPPAPSMLTDPGSPDAAPPPGPSPIAEQTRPAEHAASLPPRDVAVAAPHRSGERRAVPGASTRRVAPARADAGSRADPEVVGHRALTGRTAAVQRCVDETMSDRERISVAVELDAAGRVVARPVNITDTALRDCLDRVLEQIPRVASREPASFIHHYNLRAGSVRPSP